jgi:hypothetical protein
MVEFHSSGRSASTIASPLQKFLVRVNYKSNLKCCLRVKMWLDVTRNVFIRLTIVHSDLCSHQCRNHGPGLSMMV